MILLKMYIYIYQIWWTIHKSNSKNNLAAWSASYKVIKFILQYVTDQI